MKTITLTFPDLSGESFMSQWVERHFTVNYDNFLKESVGGVLFISPLDYRKPVRIASATPLLKEMGAAGHSNGETDDSSLAWDPPPPPTQSPLVEQLQILAERRDFYPPVAFSPGISPSRHLSVNH